MLRPRPDGWPAGPGRRRLEEVGFGCNAGAQGCNVAPEAEATL